MARIDSPRMGMALRRTPVAFAGVEEDEIPALFETLAQAARELR